MSRAQIDHVLASGQEAGLLPASAQLPSHEVRPWPVILLTGLGAWLAALPLLVALGLLLGSLMREGPAVYVVAFAALGGAVATLRVRSLPLFLEQLAVPAVLVGQGLLAYALLRDLPERPAFVMLTALNLGLGIGLARPWLRVLLGAAAAVCAALACAPPRWATEQSPVFWWAWHVCVLCWLLAHAALTRVLPRVAIALEPLAVGWGIATLAGLAWWSGMSFLVGGSLGGGWLSSVAQDAAGSGRSGAHWLPPVLSMLLMGAAALWWGRRWPTLRQPWIAGLALVCLGLAWFLPALGATVLMLACASTRVQWRLSTAAAVAVVWILGSFYYALQWPLATKAGVLVGAGVVLGGLAALGLRGSVRSGGVATAMSATALRRLRAGLALSAVAVLAVVNLGIWQKETLIAQGQSIYVALAPVDPRSLMQGDYMQLSFRLPDDVQIGPEGMLTGQRPCVVARRDARGVATLLRLDTGAALAADELRIELTPKNGRWVLVTDAWFFKEGDAERWAEARFGEFRVETDGRALLVGLRGAVLQAL